MAGGRLNGSGERGEESDKVASLDEARKRASQRARHEQRAARDAKRGGPMSARDWIIGGVFVAMALGMIWHWVGPLVGATGVTR